VTTDQFISEPIQPDRGSFDAAAMARGEPGLPRRFRWRGRDHDITETIEQWISSEAEGGSGELYLRRHWFKVRTTGGDIMTIYCERQPKPGRSARSRWWLYTIRSGKPP
jgi:hypothetical protein